MVSMCYAKQLCCQQYERSPWRSAASGRDRIIDSLVPIRLRGFRSCHHSPAIHLGVSDLFNSPLEEGDRSAASLSVVVEGGVQRKVVLNGEGVISGSCVQTVSKPDEGSV